MRLFDLLSRELANRPIRQQAVLYVASMLRVMQRTPALAKQVLGVANHVPWNNQSLSGLGCEKLRLEAAIIGFGFICDGVCDNAA